jgi:hypothetical protein
MFAIDYYSYVEGWCALISVFNVATLRLTVQGTGHVQDVTQLAPNNYAFRPTQYIFVPRDFHKKQLLATPSKTALAI